MKIARVVKIQVPIIDGEKNEPFELDEFKLLGSYDKTIGKQKYDVFEYIPTGIIVSTSANGVREGDLVYHNPYTK